MANARGRSRKRKAGLRPVPGPPTANKNDEEIDKLSHDIIEYLKNELENYKQQPGMYKEVVAIGRALQQLRSKPSGDPEAPAPPPGADPHNRANFAPPPGTA